MNLLVCQEFEEMQIAEHLLLQPNDKFRRRIGRYRRV